MSDHNNFHPLKNFKHDLPASLVVFLVAVPLCLGIALGSDAPLFSGIIAGIVGGIIVGAISRSPLGVSGPAAGLIPIVAAAIATLGFESFLVAVMIAGVIQVIFGLAKLGIIGYYFPNSVIRGMLTGIGLTIILKQIPHVFGVDKDFMGDFKFFQPDGENTFSEIAHLSGQISTTAVVISIISLAILILWEQKFMKKIGLFQIVQGPLVVVIMGIILNYMFSGIEGMALAADQVVKIPVATDFTSFKELFTFPDFTVLQTNGEIFWIALQIAVVASLETLLCVEATDKLDPYKRITPTNRELFAQGTGNIVSGLIGGLPITQVIVRSSANIQSGGRTQASAVIHGFLLLISVLLLPGVLNMVPYASLAAILLMVGYKLAKPSIFKQMYEKGYVVFIPFIITIAAILLIDLLWGIGIGLVVSILFILYNNFRMPYFVDKDGDPTNNTVRLELSQDVTFLHKANILRTLNDIPDDTHVIIDGTNAINIDPDIVEIIADFGTTAQNKGIELEVIGLEQVHLPNPVKEFSKVIKEKSALR
ncbi:MAG: SulP family inorganic anion transporter [Bacteroidia bacterium]|nr:SulP family inorganic anion transporter [Bacteroidia bacterium]